MQFVDLTSEQRAACVQASVPAVEKAHGELGEQVLALVES